MAQYIHDFGSTIQKIRKLKGMTQKEAAGNIPVSTYRKIEQDQTVCSLPLFVQILGNLHIEFQDFMFIHNDYQLTERQALYKLFYEIKSTLSKEQFETFFEQSASYLKRNKDADIEQLEYALQGLYQFSLSGDREACYEFIKPLWEKLISMSEWDFWEALTMNCILFFLQDSEDICETTRYLVKTFELFQPIHDARTIIIKVYLNAAYGLKCNDEILKAEPYVNRAMSKSDELGDKVLYYDALYKKAEIEFVKGNIAYSQRIAEESFKGLEEYEKSVNENSFLNDNKVDWKELTKKNDTNT